MFITVFYEVLEIFDIVEENNNKIGISFPFESRRLKKWSTKCFGSLPSRPHSNFERKKKKIKIMARDIFKVIISPGARWRYVYAIKFFLLLLCSIIIDSRLWCHIQWEKENMVSKATERRRRRSLRSHFLITPTSFFFFFSSSRFSRLILAIALTLQPVWEVSVTSVKTFLCQYGGKSKFLLPAKEKKCSGCHVGGKLLKEKKVV